MEVPLCKTVLQQMCKHEFFSLFLVHPVQKNCEASVIAYHLGHVVGCICSLETNFVGPSWKEPATIIWVSENRCIYICHKNEQSHWQINIIIFYLTMRNTIKFGFWWCFDGDCAIYGLGMRSNLLGAYFLCFVTVPSYFN